MNITQPLSSLRPLLVTAGMALGMVGCSLPNATVTDAAAEISDPFSSGEILQVLHVINNGEIQQAELALQQSFQPEVRDTAQVILRDHTNANERINSIAQPGIELKDTTLSNGVQMQAEEIREELTELSGSEFDCTYLQKQVELHRIALDTVRNDLRPDAEDPQVQEILDDAEPGLEEHLQRAQEARQSLEGCSS